MALSKIVKEYTSDAWECFKVLVGYPFARPLSTFVSTYRKLPCTNSLQFNFLGPLRRLSKNRCAPAVIAVVNVGVSGLASKLTVECVAHNCLYDRKDIEGKCPPEGM